MGCAAWTLTAWARAYCDAGYDAGGRFELTFLLPLVVAGEAAAALMALVIGRRLTLRAPTPVRPALSTLLVAIATVGPAWWFFATRGTLAGYPGDSGLCPPSNIPPQWPDWIPA
ncbi:hypothetical protein P1P75_32770 [Streptomyces sp. ID05-39B]|uniref:hypothetical protein n=1 Tax=Streptomyces sp. ID05-39B TaxID=3028664 RepID=UPI0029AB28BA|nr:hypothetical protein [Streptomyces sp. ID05-39B]MDX3531054.1 hypothetical protein [Streptomyces sp. ID05-39B]